MEISPEKQVSHTRAEVVSRTRWRKQQIAMSTTILNIVQAVQNVIAANDLEDHCIQTSALLAKAFHTHGYPNAYLLTVGVEIFNPALLAWVEENGPPETPEQAAACDRAGGITIHLGAGHDQAIDADRWKGHLVVVVPDAIDGRDCMFDLSVTQVNKHGYGIVLRPVVAKLKPERSFVHGKSPMIQDINGSRVRYMAYPGDKSFNDDGDCMTLRGINLALQQVAQQLGQST